MSSFRKQFQRVRQNIDQNLGRAEKTEVLSEDELNLERRVDLVKTICQNIQKKIQPCLRSLGQNNDPEKRMRKLPESGLGLTMIECSVQLDQNTPIGNVFSLAGDAQGKLAQEILKMEVDIETRIMKTLHNILENDYPSVQKLKKHLNTRTLDMDAAKSRYQGIMKQVQSGAVPPLKGEEVKGDMEDAITKVEQVKDQLATEMYTFSGKEVDICQSVLELVQVQAEFHRRSLTVLEGYLPQLVHHLSLAVTKPAFGLRLEEHLMGKPGEVAMVIEECVKFLCSQGLEEEGLFRIAGPSSKIKKLKSAFNSGALLDPIVAAEDYDVHTVASSLKQYLRELPEPLMRSDLYNDWMRAMEKPPDQVVGQLKEVASRLESKEYFINLRYVVKFLKKLSDFSDVNKMTPGNIALVMGPNLIWPPGEAGVSMLTTGLQSALVEAIVNNADAIFPGASEFDSVEVNVSPSLKVQGPPINTDHGTSPRLQVPSTTPEAKGNGADASGLPSNTSTLRKGKKPPAPQPPTQENITVPVFFSNSTHQDHPPHPPSPKIEKPRVPPPERPNIPPPDKPSVADRPRFMPPAIPVATLHTSGHRPPSVSYTMLPAITQPAPNAQSYPYHPQPPAPNAQSYPYHPQPAPNAQSYPHHPQPAPNAQLYPYHPQPAPDVPHSINNSSLMSASMPSISFAPNDQVATSLTSASPSASSSSPSNPSQLNDSSTSRLYPILDSLETSAATSTPVGVKGHSRQLSTGSKPTPPQRPQPPVPPKKVEVKSTDF